MDLLTHFLVSKASNIQLSLCYYYVVSRVEKYSPEFINQQLVHGGDEKIQ